MAAHLPIDVSAVDCNDIIRWTAAPLRSGAGGRVKTAVEELVHRAWLVVASVDTVRFDQDDALVDAPSRQRSRPDIDMMMGDDMTRRRP